tara:strand:- start:560 stop:910 length:351 start_codon:yes stop_codon:yes gene_type:complete
VQLTVTGSTVLIGIIVVTDLVIRKFSLRCADDATTATPNLPDYADDHMIKASNIIYSDISNGLNTFGRIENVLLNKNSDAVEYLFFETSNAFRPVSSTKGFVEIQMLTLMLTPGGR